MKLVINFMRITGAARCALSTALQNEMLARGFKWRDGRTVPSFTDARLLIVNTDEKIIRFSNWSDDGEQSHDDVPSYDEQPVKKFDATLEYDELLVALRDSEPYRTSYLGVNVAIRRDGVELDASDVIGKAERYAQAERLKRFGTS